MLWVLVVVAVATAVASAHACLVATGLQTCWHLNEHCLDVDLPAYEREALGVRGLKGLELIQAVDQRIGQALRGNTGQPGPECTDAAKHFLCTRHLVSPRRRRRECQTSCATYVTRCRDGRTLDWPLRYEMCRGYAEECACYAGIDQVRHGLCRPDER